MWVTKKLIILKSIILIIVIYRKSEITDSMKFLIIFILVKFTYNEIHRPCVIQ